MRQLEDEIGALFDRAVTVRAGPLSGDFDALPPEEREPALGFAPKRQRELATGRELARRALAAMGRPTAAIPIGTDRAPRWPEGVVGSISHTSELCAVALVERGRLQALGLDLELETALGPETWPSVLTPAELARLETRPRTERLHWATLTLSAKESFHKLMQPRVGETLDFLDAEVWVEAPLGPVAGRFWVEVAAAPARASSGRFEGRFVFTRGHVVSAMALGGAADPHSLLGSRP